MCTGFPCGLAGKVSACNEGDLGSIPGLGRSPGERKGYPLQYSGLENSMDCSPRGHKELDRTEQLSLPLFTFCIEGTLPIPIVTVKWDTIFSSVSVFGKEVFDPLLF